MRSPIGSFSDPLGRYYTKEIISRLLISELSESEPKLVLDLGCGDGSLSRAAASRWADALYVTVDIDKKPDIFTFDQNGLDAPVKHFHHHADVLSPDLIRSIGIIPESVDIALCNPPFIKQKWQSGYDEILKSAGLTVDLKATKNSSAEFIFIAQNLSSLRPGGQLGLIVPDGFVSGEKNRSLRQAILNENSIDTVIKLPRNMFVGTEAQAHIIVITKNGNPENPIKIKSLVSSDHEKNTITIDQRSATNSLDYGYYSCENQAMTVGATRLKDLGCEVVRGKLNSKEAREVPFKVLHTSELRPWHTHIALEKSNNPQAPNLVLAEPGDILVARVGRDLHTRVCLVTSGSMPITDCIYRVRAPISVRDKVFTALTTHAGREFLSSRAHGVSARHLPRDYLLDLPVLKGEI